MRKSERDAITGAHGQGLQSPLMKWGNRKKRALQQPESREKDLMDYLYSIYLRKFMNLL